MSNRELECIRASTPVDQTQLAELVEIHGLGGVLSALVSVCAEKSHQCEMQRDLGKAQAWRHVVLRLTRLVDGGALTELNK